MGEIETFTRVLSIAILLIIALMGGLASWLSRRPASLDQHRFLGLGARRITAGYLGGAFLFLAVLVATIWRGGPQPFVISGSTAFFLPLVLAFLTSGLFLLHPLRKVRLASTLGLVLLSVGASLTVALLVAANPHNPWCESETVACARSTFASGLLLLTPAALGFALFARLPNLRSDPGVRPN